MTSGHAKNMAAARWASHGSDWPDGHRKCTKCGEMKPNEAFHKHAACKGGYNSVCKTCRVPVSQANYLTTPKERRLFDAAKSRATNKKRDFNIELSDIVIPLICPVLGIPMTQPSLDRIDSSKGYIKGNIRVISKRANTLKNNATVDELTKVLEDLKRTQSVCEVL